MTSCTYCFKKTSNPKFCNKSCAASFNNTKEPKRKKAITKCHNCSTLLIKWQKKFCSEKCSVEHRNKSAIENWLNGSEAGLTSIGTLKPHLKKWLMQERGDRCSKCNWREVHPTTGLVPLVADHVDGNYLNNVPENIALICPNCDSLQLTYKALNKGKGRPWRRKSL